MKILGLVENMSGLVCPHCGEKIDLFGSGGGEKTAREMGIPFLGAIPADPRMVELGDQGELNRLTEQPDLEINRAYEQVVTKILNG